ncbi:peptidyl-prolyl cis-trans isomerase cyclophilin type [Thalassoporum mexicanum PCC 7367]|uniref:peptidylprolyl isomerase n=1 Tax=Thalassoporum mexicanum TaxID=3457544 RepID=UPI00029FCAF8|nr:peptidylprolyl isomerase [Pseudanabaena sp. PCC 7367]AFY68588.1 peptidyl-prolyl cis-trans isomerase cyclophilin type [Pseudanabaena sp. PCC 7367]
MVRWLISGLCVVSLVLLTSCSAPGLPVDDPSDFPTTSAVTESVEAVDDAAIDDQAVAAEESVAADTPQETEVAQTEDPLAGFAKLEGEAIVKMELDYGTVTMSIDGENAPVTAGNFIDLVDQGFYDGLKFHRVVKEPTPFVVQGGDPRGNGTGGYVDPATGKERNIPLEILPDGADTPTYGQVLSPGTKPVLIHTKGALSMARSQFPNSASSQFYITLADTNFLDGSYAVFGYVTDGMDAVEQVKQGDRIQSIEVISGLDQLKRPQPTATEG